VGAWTLELLGEHDAASRYAQEAIALARRLGHPFSEAHALIFAAFVQRTRGDWRDTGSLADQAVTIAREGDFVQLLARARTMRGWAMAQAGEVEEGMAQMREGIAAIRTVGPAFLPYFLSGLAEAHLKAGQVDAAAEVVGDALAAVERTGERFFEAELVRFRGALLADRGDGCAAEQCFRTALAMARRQQARTLERRATDSLRELLERQGRGEEAQSLVGAGGPDAKRGPGRPR
jgi:predicted ATPase